MTDINQSKESKTKTKAKVRYLRAKKERRKHRSKVENSGATPNLSRVEQPGSGEENNEASPTPVAETFPVEEVTRVGSHNRPYKRQKVDHNPEDNTQAIKQAPTSDDRLPKPRTSAAALPSFPLPTRPDAPSKSDLALLGLDKALLNAQIVDATITSPITLDSKECDTGLTEKTRRKLAELGITELFAVQTVLLPFLLKSGRNQNRIYAPYDASCDVCVSAPTGSGKTLAYVLPIIEILCSRIVTRLRALIVLPTRDLVTQVKETFEAVGKGRGLKIGSVTGQHSFAHEQSQLIREESTEIHGGSSKVDILICTPGRLMDHLNGTQKFSLQHLRFLVIDEADRLLAQSFQDWLAQVLAATRPPPRELHLRSAKVQVEVDTNICPHPDAMAPAFLHLLREVPDVYTDFDEVKESSCQKLLFSATLTKDPGKIAALELKDPTYFIVQSQGSGANPVLTTENFSMPATLVEHMIICDSSRKPLMLFHLLHSCGMSNALVFTKSTESTTRLVRLLKFFEEALSRDKVALYKKIIVCAYSSDLAPSERKTILEKFRSQEIDILICSDLISRGIDINHVSHVVSYDVPIDVRKYVHRVGRTARAGRHGNAWTLVEEQEARYFKSLLKSINHLECVKRTRVSEDSLAPLMPFYEAALAQLKDLYGRS